MQETLTTARPYASAAFEFASENNDVAAWSAMLERLGQAVATPELSALIGHPKVTSEQLLEILEEILSGQLDDKRKNFIRVLMDAERLSLAPEISSLFERARADAEGVNHVVVTSAFELDPATEQAIISSVRNRVGGEVKLHSEIDKDLIGGAVIRIGDAVVDLSVRGRLAALKQTLA